MENKSLITVIKSVISAMRYTGDVISIVASGNNWKCNTLYTYDLFVGEKIMIGNIVCTVVSVTTDSYFIFSSASKPTATTWTCLAPYFYNGTAIDINDRRLVDLDGGKMKYPFISLFEPITSDFNVDKGNDEQEEASLWLIFMTSANKQWSTDKHYSDAIDYCQNMMIRFMTACKENSDIKNEEIGSFKVIRHAKYGLIAKNKGHETELLKDDISGIEVTDFKLKITKSYKC